MAGTPGVDDATRAVVVAIYCRLSQFGGKGLGRQEEDCRRIATTRGWVVGEVYQETASANPYSKKARKEWLRLLDAIHPREFDAVVVWLEDRTNRNVVEAAEFVTLCREAGVRVIIAGNDTAYDFNDPEESAPSGTAKASAPRRARSGSTPSCAGRSSRRESLASGSTMVNSLPLYGPPSSIRRRGRR